MKENTSNNQNRNNRNQESTGIQEKIIYLFKNIYSKEAYLFITSTTVSAIILFFIADDDTGFISRLFMYLFIFVLGGAIGYVLVSFLDTELSVIKGVRRGAGTLLMIVSIASLTSGEYESNSNSSSGGEAQHNCIVCNKSYTGIGWSTIGGEQYQPETEPGYDIYCSKRCAWESQPSKWKK